MAGYGFHRCCRKIEWRRVRNSEVKRLFQPFGQGFAILVARSCRNGNDYKHRQVHYPTRPVHQVPSLRFHVWEVMSYIAYMRCRCLYALDVGSCID